MTTYDLWGREARQNTHAFYERLRKEQPICRVVSPRTGNTVWLFTLYDDCQAVVKDGRFIKDYHKFSPKPEPEESLNTEATTLDRHLLTFDPPDHTRLRALVQTTFSPRRIALLEPKILAVADMFIDEMLANGGGNLIEDFATGLPILVIAELLGIEAEDHKQFRGWTNGLIYSNDKELAAQCGMEMLRCFLTVIEKRRREPREDLISDMLQARQEGDKLAPNELLSMLFLLLTAGHETTVNMIGNGILTLLKHRDQMETLRTNPDMIPVAVEELLRFNGPVENTFTRFAGDDTEWNGTLIRKGEVVLAAMLSANRDPKYFNDPDTFDITRSPNRHLSFGGGIHYCLGAPLARLEGVIAFPRLLERMPKLALAVPEEQLVWTEHVQLHGMKALPITC